MSTTFRVLLLITIDLVVLFAMSRVIKAILKRTLISLGVKSVIGAVIGLAFELLRSGIIRLVFHEVSLSGFAAFLTNLKPPGYFGLPLFVLAGAGVGMSIAHRKSYICPNCKSPFKLELEEPVDVIKGTSLEIDTFTEPCPHCGAQLTYEAKKRKIISYKSKEGG